MSNEPIKSVVVWDEYGQNWKIQNDDIMWEEALEATRSTKDKVYWPLAKIVQGRGYGWWTTFKKLDEFELDLEKLVPNPGKYRLIDIDKEYNPAELRDMLQHFGSYLANLHHMEGMIEAQCHALREGYKSGMSVAIAQIDTKIDTISGREALVLSRNELFKQTKRMQIDNEATLLLLKGWIAAYTAAYAAVSRIISLELGELTLQTGKYA